MTAAADACVQRGRMTPSVPSRFVVRVVISVALVAAWACRTDRPVSPVVPDPSFAKGGPSSDPTVTSTTPSSAKRDTTLNVTVTGSGFDQGSRAVWALNGDTTFATTRVKTNSTTYVTGKQLVASITIAIDAPIDYYDVQVVTLGGRKGIGIELFAVTQMVDLGALSDSMSSFAYDVNASGTVVGNALVGPYFSAVEHAAKWIPTGTTWTITDLAPILGSERNGAWAVNVNGDIVGWMATASSVSHGFLLTAAGVVTDLGTPPGLNLSQANDINALGEVVGFASDSSDQSGASMRAFYWSASTGMVVLPGLSGAAGSAVGINDNGVVVGLSGGSAVQWKRISGGWSISALPGVLTPTSIGTNGDVTGYTVTLGSNGYVYRARYLQAGGAAVDLGTLGGTDAYASAVTASGRVVGYAFTKQGYQHAFSWTAAGGMKDLGTLGLARAATWAHGISDTGVIVGFSSSGRIGSDHPAPTHATLWRLP